MSVIDNIQNSAYFFMNYILFGFKYINKSKLFMPLCEIVSDSDSDSDYDNDDSKKEV